MTFKLPTFDSYFAVTMELPKLILVCPLLLCLAALPYSSTDVSKTCKALCQGPSVITYCRSLVRYFEKGRVVDHANVIFTCCLGYSLASTEINYISYEFHNPDELNQLVGILKEVRSLEMAATYAKCIRDCSWGEFQTWDVEEVKLCVNGTGSCAHYDCPVEVDTLAAVDKST
ncbi:uncharacterized protein LOC124118863 [Haliotis rufescens]|uniref:uncharacterized protein LOC124118863 n=1 Tax=Haliotis rufescens TaxID=6454 RepID=UPI001EB08A1D|nr:uncharacterized protein LOC124118863 [Haliotis rufescens]